ncbi:MAG: site-specific integrase [Rhodoferax sp.]|nr:site-specific integrase [Rhodoferax sp.]
MIDIEQLWVKVGQRSPAYRAKEIEHLRAFLAVHNCAHAQVLSGLVCEKPLDQASAGDLEASVIERVRNEKNFTRWTAAEWLRLLDTALRLYRDAVGTEIHFTRLAVILPPAQSTFAPPCIEKVRPVRCWRNAFERWLVDLGQREIKFEEWCAGTVLSSILLGALLDASKVRSLLKQLTVDVKQAQGRPYFEFHQNYANLGDFHCQRWYLDPITELLYYRRPQATQELTESRLKTAIRKLLTKFETPSNDLPQSLADLVERTTLDWYQHAARVDVEVMCRRVVAHAPHERAWSRIFQASDKSSSIHVAPVKQDAERIESTWLDDVEYLFPWYGAISKALGQSAEQKLMDLAAIKTDIPSAFVVYIDWVQDLLQGKNSTRHRLSASVIKTYFDSVVPVLLAILGDTNPVELNSQDLTEIYQDAVFYRPSQISQSNLAKGLREFHTFLVRKHKKKPLQSIRNTLGDDAGLEPVDANLVTMEEYTAAMAFLDKQLLRGKDQDHIQIAKLVMMFAFRCGMRRMEIFGLRMMDISSLKELEVLIRPYTERRLKSDAAQRIIPARFLLSHQERRDLRLWLKRRQSDPDAKNPNSYVLALPGRQGMEVVSSERTSDRIIKALQHATGHKKAKIHQLRHSFGTWMYLALRTPEYAEALPLFDHLPQTKKFLMSGQRLRKLLLNHTGGTTRTHAFAVARLLGHSTPLVSLEHYIHSTEFIHYAMVVRHAAQLRQKSIIGASGLNPRWGARLLGLGLGHFIEQVRRKKQRKVEELPSETVSSSDNALIKKGRPKKITPANWIALENVHGFLHRYASTEYPVDELCKQIGIDVEAGQLIISRTQAIGAEYKIVPRGTRAIAYPVFYRQGGEIAWAEELEKKLQRAFALSATLASAGVIAHLKYFNFSKGDVAFKGVKDEQGFNDYLKFLKLMEVDEQGLQVLLRTTGDASIPSWAKQKLASFGNVSVLLAKPPVPAKAQSYIPWVGIQLRDDAGKVWPTSTRSLMYLALVSNPNVS